MDTITRLAAGLFVFGFLSVGCKQKPQRAEPPAAQPTSTADKSATKPAAPTSNQSTAKPAPPESDKSHDAVTPADATPAGPAEMKAATGKEVLVPGLKLQAPAEWTARKPSSSMRVAEYVIPADTGEAELVAFYFGAGQGGTAQANIERWLGQFQDPADPGNPVEGHTTTFDQDGLNVSVLRAGGTYAPGAMGPGQPKPDPKPDYGLFGIIIEGGAQGSVFIKVTGPKATLNAHDAALEAFARSVKRA